MVKQWFVFAIIAAILWGIAPLFARIGISKTTPLAGVAIRSIVITIIVLFVLISSGQWKVFATLNARTVTAIIIEGLLGGLIGQYLYFKAIKLQETSAVAPIVGSYPLFTFIFAILILGEKLTLTKGLGVILVVSGIFLLGF
ncbi:MAG: hypothetical protein COS99_05550 [Candidatus Omnitrophica bacterium CG07_land_8_20_14_0_80_42_15]|uniref:EamA domain-containing protein n=1 Tax=Candidatus Aquitaenariimonas noxiae TaxID=1974741 RepID=A0A2J0L4H9_9BACT|nr:MAG: hypothetical protein COS99_05550 [Candidatus Omnitrophica bacterium CG07_land_8_20_14_0_80_42_15]